jgi:hypothetical protein
MPQFKISLGEAHLNTTLGKVLNGANSTLRLLTLDH